MQYYMLTSGRAKDGALSSPILGEQGFKTKNPNEARKRFEEEIQKAKQEVNDGQMALIRVDLLERLWYLFPWRPIRHARIEESKEIVLRTW